MTPGRNDPCPCGSGLKHKKCCGAVIAIASAARACGPCTACCDGWVAGTIEGHEMKPGTPCFFRGAGCCSIYERRPRQPCREFVCGWLAPRSPFPEEFRPDRLGVMVVVKRWRGRELYVLRSAPRDPDAALLAWMRELSQRAGCPFIYEHEGERLGFGPPEFLREMAAIVERDGRLW